MRVKARYVRAQEERAGDLYAECLAPDVVASFAPPPGVTEAVVDGGRPHLRQGLADITVVTRVTTPDIEMIDDDDHPRGAWALVERLVFALGSERVTVTATRPMSAAMMGSGASPHCGWTGPS